MSVDRLVRLDGVAGGKGVPAGGFSNWLRGTEAKLRSVTSGVEVPCGSCKGCCRSSMFIDIRPQEKETIRRIPRALLFSAPWLPKGHLVMGYDDKGQCPMFVDNECSIYDHRPQTCRDYDCRVFAATGTAVDAGAQPEIAERVARWVFDYETEEARAENTMLQRTTGFLRDNRDLFGSGSVPHQPGPLAALAVRVYRVFAEIAGNGAIELSDAAIAREIMNQLGWVTAQGR